MTNIFRKKVAVIATVLAMAASPSMVNAGAFTGAQEWTQIMNNIELVMSNATENEILATDLEALATKLEQLSVQYQQFETQKRNLEKLKDGDVSALFGGEDSKVKLSATERRYIELAKKSRDIYTSSMRYAESMKHLTNTGEKLKMSPRELGNIFRQAKGDYRQYMETQAQQIEKDTEALQDDIKQFDALRNSIKKSDGAVAAIENVAASNAAVAKIAAQTRQTMNELLKSQTMAQDIEVNQSIADNEAMEANRKRQESAYQIYRPNGKPAGK